MTHPCPPPAVPVDCPAGDATVLLRASSVQGEVVPLVVTNEPQPLSITARDVQPVADQPDVATTSVDAGAPPDDASADLTPWSPETPAASPPHQPPPSPSPPSPSPPTRSPPPATVQAQASPSPKTKSPKPPPVGRAKPPPAAKASPELAPLPSPPPPILTKDIVGGWPCLTACHGPAGAGASWPPEIERHWL